MIFYANEPFYGGKVGLIIRSPPKPNLGKRYSLFCPIKSLKIEDFKSISLLIFDARVSIESFYFGRMTSDDSFKLGESC